MELVEGVLIKTGIQQRSTNVLSNRWIKGVVKMGDAFRVGNNGIVNEDLKHLNKHLPIPRVSIEARRLHPRWFDARTPGAA
jgi:hypothetical protein